QCAECDQNVSENATSCPHCHTSYIKKQACVICRKKAKASAMTNLSERGVIGHSKRYLNLVSKLPTNRRLEPMTGFAHGDCLHKVFPIYRSQAITTRVSKKCPTCKTKLQRSLLSLMEKGDYQDPSPCKECGESVYLNLHDGSHRPCYYCGLLLDINDDKTVAMSAGLNPSSADDFSHLHCYINATDKRRNFAWLNFLVLALAAFALVIWLGR
ncbi:MAG: hypothetical protein AAFU71_17610, partial [Cyanobacteria bacterium J06632_22]